jgi:TonB family protein
VLPQTQVAQFIFSALLLIVFGQEPSQNTTAVPAPPTATRRVEVTQDYLCCNTIDFEKPDYPREARLKGVEGVVKLHVVFGVDGRVVELQPISGNPLLVDSAMKVTRKFRVEIHEAYGYAEHEITLSYTFKIETPEPAYLHLINGKVIRADSVREYTDRIEYTAGRKSRRISPSSVAEISGCARVGGLPLKEGDCVPAGGPVFLIRALPLFESNGESAGKAAPKGAGAE